MKAKLICLILAGIVWPCYADIYRFKAPDGRVYYTDEPVKGYAYKLIIRSKAKASARPSKFLLLNKKKYSELITNAATKYNIDEKLLHAVIRAESAYDTHAVSSAGAVGLMQLMPATAKRYGVVDRRDARQNIDGGTRYLKDLLKLFNSDLKLAVAGYNAGEGAVIKYKNTIPPYPETQNYVKQVLAFYRE